MAVRIIRPDIIDNFVPKVQPLSLSIYPINRIEANIIPKLTKNIM